LWWDKGLGDSGAWFNFGEGEMGVVGEQGLHSREGVKMKIYEK
jgi:hypothetical protein